ncbi:hypothetical protein DZC52_09405 [Wenzhouxiangella sediminis]|uniref:Uncharacterized protein n=2 Tax=Wenzhouxiangella sediminis TaxID=1792836 RepID=A0A3E1K8C8_9GAMM|nr:hypothetical protein DZC52_09405 [Wenzhouxiangella sediminis]
MRSAASRERLAALGIDVWIRRERDRASADAAAPVLETPAVEVTDSGAGGAVARVRMASGDGDWLLVQGSPWDGRHDVLLGDIQATIGSARCRFGQWAHSDSAGVPVDELDSRGVLHVLAFGDPPPGAMKQGVLVAPELSVLSTSAEARRRLWRKLAGEIAG